MTVTGSWQHLKNNTKQHIVPLTSEFNAFELKSSMRNAAPQTPNNNNRSWSGGVKRRDRKCKKKGKPSAAGSVQESDGS